MLENNESTPIYDSIDKPELVLGPVTADVPVVEKPSLKPQPKVIAATVVGILLSVFVAILSAVTPEMLESLGSWGVLIYAGIVALGAGIAGYVKRN